MRATSSAMPTRKEVGLKGHYIICGAGRTGQVIAQMLKEAGKKFVFIDRKGRSAEDHAEKYTILEGDITDEDTLMRGGLEDAAGLFSVVNSDADNLVTVLVSHDVRPDMPIYARASSNEQISRVIKAGASHALSPASACGYELAAKMLSQDRWKGYFFAHIRSSQV